MEDRRPARSRATVLTKALLEKHAVEVLGRRPVQGTRDHEVEAGDEPTGVDVCRDPSHAPYDVGCLREVSLRRRAQLC